MLRAIPLLSAFALLLSPTSQAALVSATPALLPPATSENASTAFFESGSESRIGLLCHNDPINKTDPTGLIWDTIADIGFLAYDGYKLFTEGAGQNNENWKALGLDGAAAAIPFATGAGVAYRAERAAARALEASSALNRVNLARQLAAKQIAAGHAFEKHAAEFGFKTRAEMASNIEKVMANPSATRELSSGRTAFFDKTSGTVVIRDPKHVDGGTAFIPKNGEAYFKKLK